MTRAWKPLQMPSIKAVAVLQQVAHGLGDLGGAEERGDELRGSVGLVAAGEAAGQHDDLAVVDGLDERLGAFGDCGGREVVDDETSGFGAGALERVGGVELAVRAGEHRNDDARLGDGPPQ